MQVPDCSLATLVEMIKNHIAEGLTIYSDSWCSYKTTELEEAGFRHFQVNYHTILLTRKEATIGTDH